MGCGVSERADGEQEMAESTMKFAKKHAATKEPKVVQEERKKFDKLAKEDDKSQVNIFGIWFLISIRVHFLNMALMVFVV